MINLNLPKSKAIKSFQWLGERIPYGEKDIKGDSYPMTWADNDEIYTSCGDPNWGETHDGLDVQKFSGGPEDYVITKVSHMNDYIGGGGNGPKPTGMICVDNVLYLAFQNLLGKREQPFSRVSQHGSDSYIIYSSNPLSEMRGSSWTPAFKHIKEPMFPGHKFGGPAFINFGKNNENARDDYVYAVSSDQWDNGTHLRLGRVPKDKIIKKNMWEWICAFDLDGEPVWQGDLNESIPIFSLYRSLGIPEMVYLARIKRYLLLTWRLHSDFSGKDGTDLIILEAPEPWGPFSLVYAEEYWEGKEFNPYCPRVPLKWMEPDGVTGWMQFSGSWWPHGQEAYYRSNIRKFKLIMA